MKLKPNPQPATAAQTAAALDEDAGDADTGALRRIYCRLYDRCLDAAIKKNWAGFTCGACPIEDSLSPVEQRQQAHTISEALVRAAEGAR